MGRRTRFLQAVPAAGLTLLITPAGVLDSDAKEYGNIVHRYKHVRLLAVEAWLSPVNDASTGAPIKLAVGDALSGVFFVDLYNSGVDYAHCAIRACLSNRVDMRMGTDSATTLASVTVDPATGFEGTLIVDLTFEAS